jgi:glycosyltransferase involved in cell wall biosynthesis
LTVTNKILHYLLAGLAVVASDTTGQREVATLAPGAVHLYKTGDPQSLAEQINRLLKNRELLVASKTAALTAAMRTFCWEKQEPILLGSVQRALEGNKS